MPVAPTYPGVYIEEVPSGVRTITGVATSITAFVGRALRGPVDDPVTINGFADFEREFGGLWHESGLGFAVQDFFMNGGGQAIVVRVFKADDGNDGVASLTVGGIPFTATSPGAWASTLRVRVEHVTDAALLAVLTERYGLPGTDFFNLLVHDTATKQTEEFRNLTVVESPRRVDQVLAAESRLLRAGPIPAGTPRPAAHVDPDADKNIWNDDDSSAKVTDAGNKGVQITDVEVNGSEAAKTGMYALEKADLFNLLVIPPYDVDGEISLPVIKNAALYAEKRRAIFIIDPPTGGATGWDDKAEAKAGVATLPKSKNAAVYFPRILKANPLHQNRLESFAPSGAVAGVIARTDQQRGVWKAPAGQEAVISGAFGLTAKLSDPENGELNPLGINCLRTFPAAGTVIWGARTTRGDDRLADEWKYLPVRRLALFIEESLYRGTQWVVFEPNDEPLWSQIRLNVGSFMHSLYRQGAFQGPSPRDAYFVKCDKETTTQADVNLGIVNVVVGFAPLKPAEFVIIKLQQMAGQIDT